MTPSAGISCDERRRVELAHDHAARALVHARHRPAAAADVEQRHGDEVDGVGAEAPHVGGDREQGEEVVVGEHDALGPTRRAARVELERDVVGPARGVRVQRGVLGDPLVVVLVRGVAADHEDRPDGRQGVGDGVEHRHEVGTDDEDLRLGVVDDELDLGRGEAPVDVDAHGVGEGGAEEHLEVLDPVLVQERDAVLRTDAGRGQAGRDTARPLVQVGPRLAAVAEHQGRAVGRVRGVLTQDVGEVLDPHPRTLPACDGRSQRAPLTMPPRWSVSTRRRRAGRGTRRRRRRWRRRPRRRDAGRRRT